MDAMYIVEQCYKRLPDLMKHKPWEFLDHGRKVLKTEDDLNAYMASYGEMHIRKCRAAFQNFPFFCDEIKTYRIEIFDWGCGQGLATLTFLDMLNERKILDKINTITLIEPSKIALERALKWIRQSCNPDVELKVVNELIPQDVNEEIGEISCSSRISVNLFSNVLDIRTISLSWLAQKVSSLAAINYIICVGPEFQSGTNTRIKDFCGYFNPQQYFSSINSYPFAYTSKTQHPYGCETRCFVHRKGDAIDLNYKECADNREIIDPYDCLGVIKDIVNDNTLNFYIKLKKECYDNYEVYFKPYINCDAVDFLLLSKTKGIILINVCENLAEESIRTIFERTEKIKNNLIDLHLKNIKIDSIVNSNVYSFIKTAIYFPNNNLAEVNSFLKQTEENKKANEEKDVFKYLYRLTDEINIHKSFGNIFLKGYKEEYYDELKGIIFSNWHSYKDGDSNFKLTKEQEEIVRESDKRIKVKGVAGCGKTQIVANKAVAYYLETGERVLILTYNISLIQYIRMRISQVPADFPLDVFEIINYHQFFKSKANQYKEFLSERNGSIRRKICLEDFDNSKFFEKAKMHIKKYKSIVIDEVQDFKTSWLQLICNYFLEGNNISIFGDSAQNIYNRQNEKDTGMPSLQGCKFIGGSWPEFRNKISKRILNNNIAILSSKFHKEFCSKESERVDARQFEIQLDRYFVKYWDVRNNKVVSNLASNICWIMFKEYKLNPSETAVLGHSIDILRNIEYEYRKLTEYKTMISFETKEIYTEIMCSDRKYKKSDLNAVRRIAKAHFTTVCECLKFSTIHSFKGWESKNVILILEDEKKISESVDLENFGDMTDTDITQEIINIDAMVYTAITRAKCNLFILNAGNSKHHEFFIRNTDNTI